MGGLKTSNFSWWNESTQRSSMGISWVQNSKTI